MESVDIILRENIRQHLKKRRLSIAELERRIGLRHAVVNIMHGRSKNPSIKIAYAIAKELGVSLEAMIGAEPPIDYKSSFARYISGNNDEAVAWVQTIASEVINAVNNFIEDNKISPGFSRVLFCIGRIYSYVIGRDDRNIDPYFVKWVCNQILKAPAISGDVELSENF